MKAPGLLGMFFLLSAPLPFAAQAGPSATALGFLSIYGTFHPSDGIPDAQARARLEPYLSPALNKLLVAAGEAQARFSDRVKDSPPLIEGDLFTSMFEGATQWKLQTCAISGKEAHCPVDFIHAAANARPTSWTDNLILVDTPQGWRLDDIAYGGRFQFGNTGRLSDTLKTVSSETP
jgi:hypothetical protein